ncbi:MAG: hypothetical protein N839_0011470 [Desulfofustis sp. PB-SRB1]|jgi:hypothetical protein|nr:hypothetical protein [Desulfofustis sp. PB-SRB1]HBH31569.1 hypothetical protein [Desulfofustis sp.]
MQENGVERSDQPVRDPQASSAGMPLQSRVQSGRGPESERKNAKNFEAKGKQGMTGFPKQV